MRCDTSCMNGSNTACRTQPELRESGSRFSSDSQQGDWSATVLEGPHDRYLVMLYSDPNQALYSRPHVFSDYGNFGPRQNAP